MDLNLSIGLKFCFFLGGMFLQLFLLTRRKPNARKLLLSLFVPLLIMLLLVLWSLYKKQGLDFENLFFLFFLVFSLFAFTVFKKDIVPDLNIAIIISFTLSFFYLFFSQEWYLSGGHFYTISFCLVAIVLGVLIGTNFKLKQFLRVLLAVWFFLVDLAVGIGLVAVQNFSICQGWIERIQHYDIFLLGMALLYLSFNLWYLQIFFPLPHRGQTWGDKLKEMREMALLLSEKYSGLQQKKTLLVVLLICQVAILTMNYFLKVIPDYSLVSITVACIPLLLFPSSPIIINRDLSKNNY